MAGLKEIRRRIASVKNTMQITRAMKLVSAAKLRRAQEAAVNGRHYVQGLEQILAQVSAGLSSDFRHPLLKNEQSEPTHHSRRVYVIAGERGLCGGFNTNILKAVHYKEKLNPPKGLKVDFVPIGKRAVSFARRAEWPIHKAYEGLPEEAQLWPVQEMFEDLARAYSKGDVSEVCVYYTEFVSALTQKVRRVVLLPFALPQGELANQTHGNASSGLERECRYDPAPEAIFSHLVELVGRSRLLQAGLESKASVHAARMTAMDAATNNAKDLNERLRLYYNRARQSTITTELIDIVGGAEAIK